MCHRTNQWHFLKRFHLLTYKHFVKWFNKARDGFVWAFPSLALWNPCAFDCSAVANRTKYCAVVKGMHSCWTETHTASQTGVTWPGPESCCLAGSLSNKLSYFRFQQRSPKRFKCCGRVWWNSRATADHTCRFQHTVSKGCHVKLTILIIFQSNVEKMPCLPWDVSVCYCLSYMQRCNMIRHNKNCFYTQSSDRPVPDEGVLNVAVRVTGWCSPASLRAQHQVSWYLWDTREWISACNPPHKVNTRDNAS